MLKPSADLIIDPKQSRYSLVVGVAKRARQIVEEAEKAGEILVEKPVDLAVHDFMEGKYRLIEQPVENAAAPSDSEPYDAPAACRDHTAEEETDSSEEQP